MTEQGTNDDNRQLAGRKAEQDLNRQTYHTDIDRKTYHTDVDRKTYHTDIDRKTYHTDRKTPH